MMTLEQDARAAEAALGLLGPDVPSDPAFAAAIDAWTARFAPLWEEVVPVQPDGAVWTRIAAAIGARAPDNVVPLKRRVRLWGAVAAGITAVAASVALVIGFRSGDETPKPGIAAPRELLAASIAPSGPGPPLAAARYDRTGRSLLVTPAALRPAPGRAYELWVIPASGTPQSLGVLEPGPQRRIVFADDLAAQFAGTPVLALSDERAGGSRTGAPEGPVVATGKLLPV